MTETLRPTHLERAAYVYVRQSTVHQVHHHREGQQRQYGLADRARHVGFTRVVVIDDDLGVSGTGKQARPGVGRLLTAVCEGTVGAVFALEASRLARNNRDWHHLIDRCSMTDTGLIDDDGVYDPRLVNDRLLLGLKGTMSECELRLFRQRARAAFEQKVQRGCVMWEVPVGFVRTDEDRVETSPDRHIQSAMQSVFQKCHELGSARHTMWYFRDEQIRLPEVIRGTAGKDVVWRLPTNSRIRQILRNPQYAGACAYGRTGTTTTVTDGQTRTSRRTKALEAWTVCLRDHHEGYIRHTGEWLTLEATALELGVSNTVITRLIAEGVLPATHVVAYAPWVITRTDLQRPAVQARIQAVHHGHKRPRPVAGQEQLPLKSDSL